MYKKLSAALTLTLALAACSSSSEEQTQPENTETPTQTSEPTTAEPTTDEPTVEPSIDASPTASEDPGAGQPSEPAADLEFTAANESSQSQNWPNVGAQALPVGVAPGQDYMTVGYDSDGTGELEWYTDGWTEAAYEDGSGAEIDLGTERVLQLWVSGIRYPDANKPFPVLEGVFGDSLIKAYSVSGPFEGMHSITIGADTDMDYAIEVTEDPLTVVIHVKKP